MTTDNIYDKIEKWLDINILHEAHDLVELLFEKELVSPLLINNYYKTYEKTDFDNEEQFNYYINNIEPQDVYEWYLVTKEGYDKFLKMEDPVFKWKNMHFWGKPVPGKKIINDFKYNKDRVKSFGL